MSRTAEAEALPDGAGKRILQVSCRSCHDLGEVTKFRGYYNRAQWRDIVVTMVQYGAEVEEKEVEVLTDYLVEHLGRNEAGLKTRFYVRSRTHRHRDVPLRRRSDLHARHFLPRRHVHHSD